MASSPRTIQKSIESLSPEQLEQVADFIAFLEFKQQSQEADSSSSRSNQNAAVSSTQNGSAPFCNIQPMFD